MADIATSWDVDGGQGDWSLSPGRSGLLIDQNGASLVDGTGQPLYDQFGIFAGGTGLVSDLDLQTAALISLFTDAEAGPDDAIPDGSADPRGWWGGEIGSKLWLRMRAKATPDLAAIIKGDIEQALAWLIADDVVAAIDVTVEYLAGSTIGALVVFHRHDGTRVSLNFSRVWETI